MTNISIIIPVYNVESFLRKCIDSILKQTYVNFECILIDDGSTDNCPVICDEYATKDPRVIVIHQKNSGVSSARNAGLSIARGEWIGFVDSDDWCDSDMFDFLLENGKKHEADISMCGYRMVSEAGDKIVSTSEKHPFLIMNSRKSTKQLLLNRFIKGYSWNKLFRRRLFFCENEMLHYDETIKYSEDDLMCFYLFKRADKIVYFPQPYYNYRKRNDSASVIYENKGLTDVSITRFNAYEKMLQTETDNSIRYRILALKGISAANACLRYINYNSFNYDDNFLFLKNIVRKNLKYILLVGSMKGKAYSCLVFIPFIFHLYCNFRDGKL